MKKNAIVTAVLLLLGTALSAQVGINTAAPTEIMDVNGTVRVRDLPLNGSANAISTKPDGTKSTAKDQPFIATKTVVVDNNGVLGYVNGLPSASGSGSGTLNVGETIARVYSVPNATATQGSGRFRLGAYAAANGLPALPVMDGIQMDLLGYDSTYYVPIIINTSSSPQNVSFQTFATQVNENRTLLNNTLQPCPFLINTFTANFNDGNNNAGWRGVDSNNIVFWSTSAAEVETTNLQVMSGNTYRWYELKWWCMETTGSKRIFLAVTRFA
ncbi:hypothetical protein V2E39_23120 [Chryseobacterium arthrosphaerae]|uniref:Uncharacterized protein n=1 Tax=Chryseobacterium arthrosphaerae TaxID=651561 RepID=A0A1B8ZV37_9FLAO|nr:hypothetical protein [Chryseobacterium arthrosphaerae]OCA75449.1 hypothetical protein BBI00_14440 [Chryseobacterium arthrosphaerae]